MNKDFAIIATGGKQYRVFVGDKLKIEKLEVAEGGPVTFEHVLLRSIGQEVEIGMPDISGAVVEATLLRNAKEKTKIVFKFHAKARYRKKKGHRQQFTEVEIMKI